MGIKIRKGDGGRSVKVRPNSPSVDRVVTPVPNPRPRESRSRETSGPRPPRSRGYIPPDPKIVDTKLLHPLLPDVGSYPVEISVVLGTHNRTSLLQRCVASIRKACSSMTYEIIVAIGSEKDPSYAWLKDQPDCAVVDGGLNGAVKAFNAAWAVSKGRYVVAMNDDAELYDDAIEKGVRYFQDPFVGQISMAFLEGGKWKNEKIFGSIPYANFSITRGSLLQKIAEICGGMWASVYYTYGGDTELSCWVYRLGYKVVEAPDARVRHDEHRDELRAGNSKKDVARRGFFRRWPSIDRLSFRGPEPSVQPHELEALRRIEVGETPKQRWSRIPSLDPEVGRIPANRISGPERFLHFQLWTEDDPQTSMVEAFRAMGSAGHSVVQWTSLRDTASRDRALVEAARQLQPTIVFLQLQGAGAVSVDAVRQIRSDVHDPSMVIATWSGDVGPTNGPWAGYQDSWAYEMWPHADLMLFTGTGQVRLHRERGMENAAYLQIGYDEDRYHPGDEQWGARHDVVFMGQDYHRRYDALPGSEAQLRRDVVNALRSIPRSGIYGGGWGPKTESIPQRSSGKVYRESLMAVSISLTNRLARYTSDRLFRSLACGTPTLVRRFDDQEGLGLIDGENCIAWDTCQDLVEKIRHWVEPSRRDDLRSIGMMGSDLARSHHTWSVRVQELAALVAAVRGSRT